MKSPWKRNIDEPFNPKIIRDLTYMDHDARTAVNDTLATDIVAKELMQLWHDLAAMGGTPDDFALCSTMVSEKVLLGALKLMDMHNALSPRYITHMIRSLRTTLEFFESDPTGREKY